MAAIDEASRTLFQFGRAFGRLPARDLLESRIEGSVELSAILIVQAIERAEQEGVEPTVGEIAARLGVDPSTASRLVARAETAGYLRRRASLADGRASVLALSDEGRALSAGAARYQRNVFDAATATWSDEERQEFARLFVRFADAILAALNEGRR